MTSSKPQSILLASVVVLEGCVLLRELLEDAALHHGGSAEILHDCKAIFTAVAVVPCSVNPMHAITLTKTSTSICSPPYVEA